MTTGDTTLDAFVLFAVTAGLLLPLVVLAFATERTERGARWADRLLVILFGERE